MSDTAMSIIKANLMFFGVAGTFGNSCIVAATYKKKSMHHKCEYCVKLVRSGILLAILAACDLLCILNEMQSLIRMMFNLTESVMIKCYYANLIYIFIENMEVYMIFAVAIDRQMAISLPFKYRTWRLHQYIVVICLPGVFYGLFFVFASIPWLTDEVVNPCVLPYSMPPNVMEWWNKASMIVCILTVVIYGFTYLKLYVFFPKATDENGLNQQQLNKQKATLSTIIIQVAVFFFSSALSAGIILGMRLLNFSEDALIDADVYAVIPGLISYSCNFYVYFWRSAEYRDAFIQTILCGRTIVSVQAQEQARTNSMMQQSTASRQQITSSNVTRTRVTLI